MAPSVWRGRLLHLWLLALVPWTVYSDSHQQETCLGETLHAECPPGHVIVMQEAMYGRMRVGRCVQVDLGHLGCSEDVLSFADSVCSGLHSCDYHFSKKAMEDIVGSPCFSELVTYLDVRYQCTKVVTAGEQCTPFSRPRPLDNAGVFASHVTDETDCGSPQAPWIIHVKTGQRISVTVTNFEWTAHAEEQHNCILFGYIKEPSLGINNTLCGDIARAGREYTSTSNKVEIHILPASQRSSKSNFLVEYKVIGCPAMVPPANAWYKRVGNRVQIGCQDNNNIWTLMCKDNKWEGRVGNCTATGTPSATTENGRFKLSPVVTISLITSLALLVILLVFAIGIGYVCMKRRKKKNHLRNRRPIDLNKYVTYRPRAGYRPVEQQMDCPPQPGQSTDPQPAYQTNYQPGLYKPTNRENVTHSGPYGARQGGTPQTENSPRIPIWKQPLPEPNETAAAVENSYDSPSNLPTALCQGATLKIRGDEKISDTPAKSVDDLSHSSDSSSQSPRRYSR